MTGPSTPISESVNHVPHVDQAALFIQNLLSLNVEQSVFYELVEKATPEQKKTLNQFPTPNLQAGYVSETLRDGNTLRDSEDQADPWLRPRASSCISTLYLVCS
ncbi:hypothetical protein TSUD_171280 [Trifolium subterraneum]|uniref:Uncharacterized protein n=1 Tax=Trifolium subterraneum TaxID=3900 RepID=A0A2Z6LJM8_TRISU|nr:hypothetical protein TSUD_171280 [Trifolium subterraneum]